MTASAASAPFTNHAANDEKVPRSLLLFTKTAQFRHDSIPAAILALQGLAEARSWSVIASDDTKYFTESALEAFDVVVFLSTTGDVLSASEQGAFEAFVRRGGGYVGVHAAADTEYEWGWYGGLVGAYFRAHPPVQAARIIVEDPNHPSSAFLPQEWQRSDEWYGFASNPRGVVNVLLRLDESSYSPAESSMGQDHPIAWYHSYQGGRSFYTALGHTQESYSEPLLLEHLASGIDWAAQRNSAP
jgi:cytochrome c